MRNNNYIKLVIKVLNTKHERVEWVHLCYVKKDLYNQFLTEKGYLSQDMNAVISRWIREDFNTDIAMSSSQDIVLLKGLLKDFYKRAHPEFFMDNDVDRQGWTRTWVTRKMMEELKLYVGTQSI